MRTLGGTSGPDQGQQRPAVSRYARELSIAAGVWLVCFEAAELGWIGFQPLEAAFAAVGVIIIGLARRLPRTQP
jgi:hypothetical protein